MRHFSSGLEEYVCVECFWIEGEYTPMKENMYSIQEWCMITGMWWKQRQAKQLTHEDYMGLLDDIGIL